MKFISVMCYDHNLKCNEEMLVCVDFIICVSRSCSEDKSLFYLNLTNQAGTSIQSIFMAAEERDEEYYRLRGILMPYGVELPPSNKIYSSINQILEDLDPTKKEDYEGYK